MAKSLYKVLLQNNHTNFIPLWRWRCSLRSPELAPRFLRPSFWKVDPYGFTVGLSGFHNTKVSTVWYSWQKPLSESFLFHKNSKLWEKVTTKQQCWLLLFLVKGGPVRIYSWYFRLSQHKSYKSLVQLTKALVQVLSFS